MVNNRILSPISGCLILIAIFTILLQGGVAIAQEIPPSITEARKSVFRVGAQVGNKSMMTGTGFAIDKHAIMTNAHVIEGTREAVEKAIPGAKVTFFVVAADGKKMPVDKVEMLGGIDLAVLKVIGPDLKPLSVTPGRLAVDSSVWALGYPGTADFKKPALVAQQSSGSIQSYQQYDPDGPRFGPVTTIRHDAPISPGSSGGPLLDACGQVIGVNTFGATTKSGQIAAGATKYSVSGEDIVSFANANASGIKVKTGSTCRAGSSMSSGFWAIVGAIIVLAAGVGLLLMLRTKKSNTNNRPAPEPAPLPATDNNILHLSGENNGKTFQVQAPISEEGIVNIGRAPTNDIVLDFDGISRNHALVRKKSDGLFITDLGSTNGTFVDGKRLEPKESVNFDKNSAVKLGKFDLEVSLK